MKVKEVFKKVLFEQEEKESLKIMYDIDIIMDRGDDGKFVSKSDGEVPIEKKEAENIQTIEDLVAYISRVKIGGKGIIDDMVKEIILNLSDGDANNNIGDLISDDDKIIIGIDYGEGTADSIGFKINKIKGSSNISISMKKDGNILASQFSPQEFNKQLVFFRNSAVNN